MSVSLRRSNVAAGGVGAADVCLSLPSIVNFAGVVDVRNLPPSDRELEPLRPSRAEARAVAAAAGQ